MISTTNKLTSLALLSVLLAGTTLPFDCFANDLSPFANLSHTDGHQLLRKLPTLDKKQRQLNLEQGKNSCQSECVTPFGELLGKADGIEAFSNCRSTCIKPEYSFLNLTTKQVVTGSSNPDEARFHYIGVVHQCVEYARKWWMINNGVTFGSIDSAFEIIYLTEGKNIYTNQAFPLGRSINGSASRAPARGDLATWSCRSSC